MERPSVPEERTAAEPAEPVPKPLDHAPPAEPKRAPSVSENVKESAITPPPAPEPEEPVVVTEDMSIPAEPAKPVVDEEASIGMSLDAIYAVVYVANMSSFRCSETRCLVEDSERSRLQTTWRTAFWSETGSRRTRGATADQQWPQGVEDIQV